MGKSEVLYYFKDEIKKRYVMELVIYKIVGDKKYPENIKYSLVFIEAKTGRKVLIDNHYPKSHHFHLDDVEIDYSYKNEEQLIEDFKRFVFEHFGEKI